MACDCRRLCTAFVCRRHGVSSVCHSRGATFICMKAIQTSKIYSIRDKKSNQWSPICYIIGIIGILVIIVISNM